MGNYSSNVLKLVVYMSVRKLNINNTKYIKAVTIAIHHFTPDFWSNSLRLK